MTSRPAVLAIAALAAAGLFAADGVFETILAPASSSSIRKTEAAIVALKDGRLLLAYTDFYTVSPRDDGPARIRGRHSSDLGRTWSAPFTIVENTARVNVMSVSLLRLQSGEIALTYMFKNSLMRTCPGTALWRVIVDVMAEDIQQATAQLEALAERRTRAAEACRGDRNETKSDRVRCPAAPDETGTSFYAYYTISTASIPLVDLPPDKTKRLPRYATVSAVRIGRLSLD